MFAGRLVGWYFRLVCFSSWLISPVEWLLRDRFQLDGAGLSLVMDQAVLEGSLWPLVSERVDNILSKLLVILDITLRTRQ